MPTPGSIPAASTDFSCNFRLSDFDGDRVPDSGDNCLDVSNPDQTDTDEDGLGDPCDPFPEEPDNELAQCNVDLVAALGALDQTTRDC